jgi:hypothetical protein
LTGGAARTADAGAASRLRTLLALTSTTSTEEDDESPDDQAPFVAHDGTVAYHLSNQAVLETAFTSLIRAFRAMGFSGFDLHFRELLWEAIWSVAPRHSFGAGPPTNNATGARRPRSGLGLRRSTLALRVGFSALSPVVGWGPGPNRVAGTRLEVALWVGATDESATSML